MSPKSSPFAMLILVFALYDGVTGACKDDVQNTSVQKCEKAFVDVMAKNTNANCSAEMDKMHACLTKLSKECYPNVDEKMIKQLVSIGMKQFQAMDFYCSSSKSITPKWSNVAPAIREKLPCQNKAAMNESSYKCSKDFRTNLHKTPKSSDAIYRSYDESNKCMKEEATRLCPTKSHATVIVLHAAILGLLPVTLMLVIV